MAVASMQAGKPLRLKDLLALDCDSCSAAGFRCYPRRLCVAPPAPAPMRPLFERSPSRLRRRPVLLLSHLSRRLRSGFTISWRRRDDEEEPGAEAPAPVATVRSSGCCNNTSSSNSETSESGSESSSAERKCSESDDFSSASSTESPHAGVVAAAKTAGDKHEGMKRGSKEAGFGSEADDKEQLSPVAVMDFPFDDGDDAVEEEEEGDAGSSVCWPTFSDSLAQLHQRRNIQLQYKIRRLGAIAELGTARDLDARFAACSDDDPVNNLGSVDPTHQRRCCSDVATAAPAPPCCRSVDECKDPDELHSLLGLLTGTVSVAGGVDRVSERLLLDLFAETRKASTSYDDGAAVRLAKSWLEGTGARWGLKEALCRREDLVAEMEGWSACVGGDEREGREVGVVVAGFLLDELVLELVRDLRLLV